MSTHKIQSCWIITEGLAGTENQCIGVAEALGIEYQIKRISLRQPWKMLSPYLGFETPFTFAGDALTAPWPDLILAGGRKAIAACRYIKRKSVNTRIVFFQNPRAAHKKFDMIIAPAHDQLSGGNVFVTSGAANRITDGKLRRAKKDFQHFESIKPPRAAVIIGGNSKTHKMTKHCVTRLVEQLKTLDVGFMITPSRRTGEENLKLLHDPDLVKDNFIWDGNGENPYFGMLAWADFILVTEDSVSMISDAASTGKPVYIIELEGGSAKHKCFHQNLQEQGIIKTFTGSLKTYEYPPLKTSENVANEIRRRFYS